MSLANVAGFGNAVPWRADARAETGRVVLIVTNDDELAQAMQIELEAAGFVVSVARSGPEGLHAFRSRGASAVIVDRMTGGLEGLMVVETLRTAGDATPMLAVGAPESVEERIAYIRTGADDSHAAVRPSRADGAGRGAAAPLSRRPPDRS